MIEVDGKPVRMKDDYLYLRIYEELKGEITEGAYETGGLFPSERTLKERFSTTHITVRNALTRLVEEGYIERFSGKGTFVTYRGSEEEKKEDAVTLHSVQFILEKIDTLSGDILNHVAELVKNQDFDIVIDIGKDPDLRKAGKETFQVLLFPESSGEYIPHEGVSDNTLIVSTRDIDSSSPMIICDIPAGMGSAVRYAHDKGHSGMAYVGTCLDAEDMMKREAFSEALRREGLQEGSEIPACTGGDVEAAFFACARVLEEHPDTTVFICADDVTAAGILNFLSRNREAGEPEVMVIGTGGTMVSTHFRFPSLDLKPKQLAVLIVQSVMEYASRGKVLRSSVVVQPELVVRLKKN